MKLIYKFSICFFLIVFVFAPIFHGKISFAEEEKEAYLSIVIDDFGQSRSGVEEMLSLNCPLTCAIMPGLQFTKEDAENAFKNGHEVILHMPMEAYGKLPDSWYGPKVIRNYDSPEKARAMVKECLEEIPHAVGMNIHIGSGVSLNKKLMSAIIDEAKQNGKYFLDSKTVEGSVCPEVAKAAGINFAVRDFFLELTGNPSYSHAVGELKKALKLAKAQGHAIAIGHVGPEGGKTTARAINDMLAEIEKEGVKIVPLSKIIERLNSERKEA